MHTRLLIIFLVIFPNLLFAQLSQLQIISKPERSEAEIVNVRDASGQFCAAIQVISDMEGFRYDSYNGVVKVDDRPGSDLVYLSPDERVLQILHGGYEPLKIILSEIGIQLEAKSVWVIKLAGEISLSIDSYPKEAEVHLDNSLLGKTPYHGRIRIGKYEIMLKKELYHDFHQTVQISGDKAVQYVFDMMPKFGALIINSKPSGAEVFLDGSLKGKTSLVIDTIPSGQHQLIVRKWPLYQDDTRNIQIADGKDLNVTIILNKKPKLLFYKQPGKGFVLSLMLPGTGQIYAKSSALRVGFFSLPAIFTWWGTYMAITETRKADKNANYLYSLDPTGIDPNYKIYNEGEKQYMTGQEWKEYAKIDKKLAILFILCDIAVHTWSAIDAKNQVNEYNKRKNVPISFYIKNGGVELAFNKYF